MLYFTSDLHLFGKKEPRVGTRVFTSDAEREAFLIGRWNDTVGPADEVYLLGDISDGDGAQTTAVLQKLNGTKYLVEGNNDHYLQDSTFDPMCYAWVKSYFELHTQGTKFVLFHFPLEVWSGYNKDRVHLHGHMHRLKAVYEPIRRYEVGVDAHDGRPVSLDEIWAAVEPLHNKNRQMPR